MRAFDNIDELEASIGDDLGFSSWYEVTQDVVDRYADLSGDNQWIHVDPVRAADGPFGTTIAHGYLTVTLMPKMLQELFELSSRRMGVNYGMNRLRFTAPVKVGSSIRAHASVKAVQRQNKAAQLTLAVNVESTDADRPVCVAEPMVMVYE